MKAVIQRVSHAKVEVNLELVAEIGLGLIILLGIHEADDKEDLNWLTAKISKMRIFSDENVLMNKCVEEIGGEIIVVSQFTLYASTKKGNRPSFIEAARPEKAIPFYEEFCKQLREQSKVKVKTGIFGADMKVSLLNYGPVTIVIDSRNRE